MFHRLVATYDLTQANSDHYEFMNILFTNWRFVRSLPGNNGGTVHLPNTTWLGTTYMSVDQVYMAVRRACAANDIPLNNLFVVEMAASPSQPFAAYSA